MLALSRQQGLVSAANAVSCYDADVTKVRMQLQAIRMADGTKPPGLVSKIVNQYHAAAADTKFELPPSAYDNLQVCFCSCKQE